MLKKQILEEFEKEFRPDVIHGRGPDMEQFLSSALDKVEKDLLKRVEKALPKPIKGYRNPKHYPENNQRMMNIGWNNYHEDLTDIINKLKHGSRTSS